MRSKRFFIAVTAVCLLPSWIADASDARLYEAHLPPAAQRLTLGPDAAAPSAAASAAPAWVSPRFDVSGALWTRVWFTIEPADFARLASLEVETRNDGDTQTDVFWENPQYEPDWEDLRISSPMISAPEFRVIARAKPGDSGAKFEFALTSLLMQPEPDAAEAPSVKLGGIDAALERVTDERRLRRYVRETVLLESTIRGATWEKITPNESAAEADSLERLAAAVPRLSRRAPQCELAGVEDAESRQHIESGTLGCTAFRVGEDLFATAWHCLPDNFNGGCGTARIEFGYQGVTGRAAGTALVPERCQEVAYRSARLDLALFRVKRANFVKWSKTPVLKFIEGAGNLPFEDEPLAILHYPSPDTTCNPRAIEAHANDQLGLRVSRWSKSSSGGTCKVFGKGVAGAAKRFRLNPPRDPESSCDTARLSKRPNRDIGFGHLCATCEGSSGAPVLSMADDPARRGKVLGVHVNAADSVNPRKLPNRAVRAHAIADCIDVAALNAEGIVRAAPGAAAREVCACTGDDVCAPPNPADQAAAAVPGQP